MSEIHPYRSNIFLYLQRLVTVVGHGEAMGDKDDGTLLVGKDVMEQFPLCLRVKG